MIGNFITDHCFIDSVLAAVLSVEQNDFVHFVALTKRDRPRISRVTWGVCARPEIDKIYYTALFAFNSVFTQRKDGLF